MSPSPLNAMEFTLSYRLLAILVPQALFATFYVICHIFRRWTAPTDQHLVPYRIPILKNTIPFVFNGYKFFQDIKKRASLGTTLRISIIGDDVYLVQGSKGTADLFSNPNLTVTRAYSLVLKQCFGMHQKSVNAYLDDTSGSRDKPIPGSTHLRPADRISFMTHENLVPGLLTDGLGPAFDRFQQNLDESLHRMDFSGDEWLVGDDLMGLFAFHHTSSLIRALFGDVLLDDNPSFVSDLWTFDKGLMSLAQRRPRFLIPDIFNVRDKLVRVVQQWHSKAVTSADDSVWGTPMMKARYSTLLRATAQDQNSLASTDMALIWATVTNVIPSSMTMAIHTFRSPKIIASLRASLDRLPGGKCRGDLCNIKDLDSIPLLSSLYAETLRFGVQIHIPRSAPYHDVHIGGVTIPRNKLIVTNTWLAHHDETIWDTGNGTRPLDQFCGDRFLVDPNDQTSGPSLKKKRVDKQTAGREGAVYFSTEGLEGAWIPYGGGQHACPGRLLAKRILLFSTALLVRKFDIEILAADEELVYGAPRFGFGVAKLSGPVKFRIRRRIDPLATMQD